MRGVLLLPLREKELLVRGGLEHSAPVAWEVSLTLGAGGPYSAQPQGDGCQVRVLSPGCELEEGLEVPLRSMLLIGLAPEACASRPSSDDPEVWRPRAPWTLKSH